MIHKKALNLHYKFSGGNEGDPQSGPSSTPDAEKFEAIRGWCDCALKNKNKNTLSITWIHNPKAWITKVLTSNWFHLCFVPQKEENHRKTGKVFLVLLSMDKAWLPCGCYHKRVQIEFLPSNTTSLLQPMDEGEIYAFKAQLIGGTGLGDVTHEEFNELIDTHCNPLMDEEIEEENGGLTLKLLAELMRKAKKLREKAKS
ncbi:HTH CENPB-type domain-containing protein [Nephila pilipes]|uniref:HTH CENPB-type domain-containing protein n=1 Tax=Nephila pilipes TaxID=299642 RepID=A0A8X6PI16_NEPPI|nr:HTH CENPB-type domain-containing protein [Nephila pilipes]